MPALVIREVRMSEQNCYTCRWYQYSIITEEYVCMRGHIVAETDLRQKHDVCDKWEMFMQNKCKDCKWLTGKKTKAGVECMNPENQSKWLKKMYLWMGEFRQPNARYKQPCAPACKKFEPK